MVLSKEIADPWHRCYSGLHEMTGRCWMTGRLVFKREKLTAKEVETWVLLGSQAPYCSRCKGLFDCSPGYRASVRPTPKCLSSFMPTEPGLKVIQVRTDTRHRLSKPLQENDRRTKALKGTKRFRFSARASGLEEILDPASWGAEALILPKRGFQKDFFIPETKRFGRKTWRVSCWFLWFLHVFVSRFGLPVDSKKHGFWRFFCGLNDRKDCNELPVRSNPNPWRVEYGTCWSETSQTWKKLNVNLLDQTEKLKISINLLIKFFFNPSQQEAHLALRLAGATRKTLVWLVWVFFSKVETLNQLD